MVSAELGSVTELPRVMAVPSGLWPLAGAPVIVAVGATLLTVRVKVVVAVRPSLSVAVMVTVVGPVGPSDGVNDQRQVPVALSWAIVPSEAVRVTVPRPWGSLKVPVLLAGEPSLTARAAWSPATVGGWFGGCTSTAPRSTWAPETRARPRWSVVTSAGTRALLPASMATLPPPSRMVSVGPPLGPRLPRLSSAGVTTVTPPLTVPPVLLTLVVVTVGVVTGGAWAWTVAAEAPASGLLTTSVPPVVSPRMELAIETVAGAAVMPPAGGVEGWARV